MRIPIVSTGTWSEEQTERTYGEPLKRFDYDGKTIEIKTIEELIELSEICKNDIILGAIWHKDGRHDPFKLMIYDGYIE